MPEAIQKRAQLFSLLESTKNDFVTIFGPKIVPKASPNRPPNPSKIDSEHKWPLGRAPRRSKDPAGPHFESFLIDFEMIWA